MYVCNTTRSRSTSLTAFIASALNRAAELRGYFTMNDPDRDGEEGGNDPVPPLAAIESLDDYIRRYGLPHANGGKALRT